MLLQLLLRLRVWIKVRFSVRFMVMVRVERRQRFVVNIFSARIVQEPLSGAVKAASVPHAPYPGTTRQTPYDPLQK